LTRSETQSGARMPIASSHANGCRRPYLSQRHAGAAAEALLLDGGLPRSQLPRDVRGQPVLLDLDGQPVAHDALLHVH